MSKRNFSIPIVSVNELLNAHVQYVWKPLSLTWRAIFSRQRLSLTMLAAFCLSFSTLAFVQIGHTQMSEHKSNAVSIAELPNSKQFRRHLIARTSFGITPALDAEVAEKGSARYLASQLNPYPDGRPSLDLPLPAKPYARIEGLQAFVIEQMLESPNQLNELMTQFWDNHFNTLYRKTFNANYFELRDNQRFRIAALGRFRDLLDISGKSPAMMTYLDNRHSTVHNVGENYARELLELHTMGVDGGYTQHDVEFVAEVFTGWGVANRQFRFKPEHHVTGFKRFQGKIIRAGLGEEGILEGQELLDMLALHPSTARHICNKLIQFFVSDNADSELSISCAEVFLAQAEDENQIAKVIAHLLQSSQFSEAAAHQEKKFSSPLRYAVSIARLFEINEKNWVNRWVTRLGMPLFSFALPTGYSDSSDDWMSPAGQIQRLRFAADATEFAALKRQLKSDDLSARFVNQLDLLSKLSNPSPEFNSLLRKLKDSTNTTEQQSILAALIVSPEAQLY